MYIYILFLFIICLIIIIVNADNIPLIPKTINQNPLKCCILLTMYVKNREEMYNHVVNRWLNETNLNIYIVDSSNQGLSITHPRLHQFKFQQLDKFVTNNPSMYEANLILKAINYFNFKKYDIESVIDYIPETDFLLQYRTDTEGQNTEILGIKSNLINIILSKYKDGSFESFIYHIKNNYKYYKFNAFRLDNFVKRSDGSILKFL